MIALDTNVLVRYIVQDDPMQSGKATRLVEGLTEVEQGFFALMSVVELVWVLQGCYGAEKADIVAVLENMLSIDALVIEQSDTVRKALKIYQAGNADFADCLICCSAAAAGCKAVMTFDKNAASSAIMTLIQ